MNGDQLDQKWLSMQPISSDADLSRRSPPSRYRGSGRQSLTAQHSTVQAQGPPLTDSSYSQTSDSMMWHHMLIGVGILAKCAEGTPASTTCSVKGTSCCGNTVSAQICTCDGTYVTSVETCYEKLHCPSSSATCDKKSQTTAECRCV